MKKNWYYRTLLSYAPIFFVIISSFIFVYFATLNSSSQNKYIETNQAILKQVVHNADANLQLIERIVSKRIFSDSMLQSYFDDTPKTVYDYYLIQKDLLEFSSTFPFASSIYLYNEERDEFLTATNKFTRDTFGDSAFLDSAYRDPGIQGWTNPREYRQTDQHHTIQVVSLFKNFPYASDRQGGIVLNVHVSSIMEQLNRLNNNESNPILLLDGNDRPFQGENSSYKGKPVSVQSDYTGWQFYSESVHAGEYTLLSMFSNLWIVFGLVVIVLAIVWFTIVTHSNYKPIHAIVGKIGPYMARRSEGIGIKSSPNDLQLIEGAIDQLLEKTAEYDDLHKERKLQRLRSLYFDLLHGYRTLSDKEWSEQIEGTGGERGANRVGVIMLEIDRYAEFKQTYSPSDQYLLKYIVENALHELIGQRRLSSWQIWVHPHQLAAAVYWREESDDGGDARLLRIGEEYREWINDNLELTVSIGIGETVSAIGEMELSYRSACARLSYKFAYGTNVVIDRMASGENTGLKKNGWRQSLQETVHYLRLNDSQWQRLLDEMLLDMRRSLMTKAEMGDFAAQLAGLLQKEMASRSEQLGSLWSESYAAEFRELAEAETLEEVRVKLPSLLARAAQELEKERASRSNHSMALRIKAYIDQHYADPNLSLNQVSELFGVSPKSVSSFFKEELDMKFLDYILQVRFEHARRMLVETDEPIQHIAERVGYLHVISFHRAFKKLFNLPPGEYRNVYRSSSSS